MNTPDQTLPKGYTAVSVQLYQTAPDELRLALGFSDKTGSACSLCPYDAGCREISECRVGYTEVLVPDHVAMVLKLHALE